MGERQIIKHCKNYLIIRTNFRYGTKYKISYSEFILDTLKKKKIFLNNNIYFSPVYICNLIKISDFLLKNNIKGLFNISADDTMSKYKFGLMFGRYLNLKEYLNKIFMFKNLKDKIRPTHMSLSNNKIKVYKFKIGTIDENVKLMIKDRNHLLKLKNYIR